MIRLVSRPLTEQDLDSRAALLHISSRGDIPLPEAQRLITVEGFGQIDTAHTGVPSADEWHRPAEPEMACADLDAPAAPRGLLARLLAWMGVRQSEDRRQPVLAPQHSRKAAAAGERPDA